MVQANGTADQDRLEHLKAGNDPSLGALSSVLDGKAHLLLRGDEQISQSALLAVQSIFDQAVSLESLSHPHLHPFLASILTNEPAITLRSSTLAKSNAPPAPPPPKPEEVLPYTPLSNLTVDGLDHEQIWQQLELRNKGICNIIGEIVSGPEMDEDLSGVSEEDDDSEDSEGSDEDMTVEEFERMMLERGDDSNSEDDSEEDDDEEGELDDESDEEDSNDDDDDDDDEDNLFKLRDEAEEDDLESDPEEQDEFDLADEEEFYLEDADEGEEDDDDDQSENELEDGPDVDGEADEELDHAGPSKQRTKSRHPTLDDDFFSIDAFNQMTEEEEAGRVTSGKLGGDDEDDEELADVGEIMLRDGGEDDAAMYADFFEPPRGSRKPQMNGKGKGKKNDEGKSGSKKKSKGVRFDQDNEEEREEEEEEDMGRDVMSRVKGDLFESDEEEDEEEQNLSTHEKRQLALRKQIAELESEAIGPKDWTLLGEATSKSRPENSLLEEHLDFEHAGKVVPQVTEETVKTLEDLIKKRILDNNFNSPVRVRAYEPTPFLPSRYLELQDTQSSKSLAQIYEQEYQSAASGTKVKDPRDVKLSKEHEEIEKIWNEICYKLDALSSLNFVPKQPKAQIKTIDNLPTTTLESALPATSSTTTMLAPEELFAPPSSSSLVARSELTPEEKQRQRQKNRKAKAADRKSLGEMAELYGKKKKSVKEQKEEALKGLVKSGKGVTVVGKGDKELGKVRKRQAEDGERADGKRLKL